MSVPEDKNGNNVLNGEADNTNVNVEDQPPAKTEEKTDDEKNEEQTIKDYVQELSERFRDRREKRYQHNPSNIEYPDESFFGKLDTSIKKNTAFVKKIRNITESNRDVIMKDLENLNLSRYISELASALVETKIKANEISLLVQICSFLHRRYSDFASHLLDCWIKCLPRKPTDTFNASKMRIDIKIFSELILSGIFSAKDSLPALGNLLTILTTQDKDSHKNLNIVIAFCRGYGVEFAGLVPRKMRLLAEKFGVEIPSCDFLSAEKQRGVQALLKDYHQSVKNHVSKDRKHVRNLKNDMKRFLETKGEIPESLQEKWKMASSEYEKLYTTAQTFADLVDEDSLTELEPESLDKESLKTESVTAVLFNLNQFRESNLGVWDDEETRTFYENLPDLKSLVPSMLYRDSLKDAEPVIKEENDDGLTGTDMAAGDTNEIDMNKDTDLLVTDSDIDSGKDLPLLNETDEIENEQKEEKKAKNAKMTPMLNLNATKDQLDSFFTSLPNCVNRDLIDKAALTFATTFNTKNNRRKLVNALISVSRTRLDLLPFYSRFVAQLAPIMPTVATDLHVALRSQFRYNFMKKDQVNISSKVKIVRFIGELVKFKIFPKSDVHKIFKMLLSDFHHHNIEMTCNLFETCGVYLYRCPDSHHMINLFLQQMMRFKNHMRVNTWYETMIMNTYYLINPDERLLARSTKSKPLVHQYIEYLIFNELKKGTVLKVSKKLRKIDWNNRETSAFAIECLSKAWQIKFYNISSLANLLVILSQYHSNVVLMVLDSVLEDIRLGMQMNLLFEYNQRRIAMVKYLAECFNFNLVDSTLLISVMYSLIIYGINYQEGSQCLLDPPFNLMRLRLVGQLLQTCGPFMASGSSRKKLEYFLYFFQRYYWFKKHCIASLPAEEQVDPNAQLYIDNIFKEATQNLKVKIRSVDSYEAACKQLETLIQELAANAKDILPNTKISVESVLNPAAANAEVTEPPKTQVVDHHYVNDSLEPIKEDSEEDGSDDDPGQDSNDSSGEDDSQEELDDCEINNDCDAGSAAGNDNRTDEESECDTESGASAKVNQKDRFQPCEEDDAFQRDFERLINENLATRSQEALGTRANVEIAIPIERDADSRRNQKFPGFSFEDPPSGTSQQKEPAPAFNFRVMTKAARSNKPVLRSVEVPIDSELVQNFLAREQAHREEKEHVKKLILNINQRRELEDSGGGGSGSGGGHPANPAGTRSHHQGMRFGPGNQGNYYHRRFN